MKNMKDSENKKDLKPGKKIVQTRTHGVDTAFPVSTQVPTWQSSQKKISINSKERQSAIRRLNKIKTEKNEAYDFLRQIKQSFMIKDIADSNYVENKINGKNYTLRISNHSVNSYYSDKKAFETSFVIELSKHDFVDYKDRFVKEYVYYPENLTKEVKDNILKGLVDWINTGTYSYDRADKINISSALENKERNVALIDGTQKITRSQFLENKTELTDDDIVMILDLPAEKEIRSLIKSYTDKDYLELTQDTEKLSELTDNLKNDAEYLTYRGSYIAKSKLLYESSVTLCNEIPSLLIAQEIGDCFYLLPYGYAKDKSENFKKFADMLERDNFIDIKRNYSTKLKHNFKKGHNQGNNIFFFITSDKTDYEKIRQEINKCVYNRKEVQNKTAKYIVYIEQSNRCGSFSFDTTGKLVTEKEYTLKQIRSFDNERPLVARGRMQSIPSGTIPILNNNDETVNNLFHSLLLRGEIEMINVHPELHIYSEKYKEACKKLENISKESSSELLRKSNSQFLESEKQTQFYKDLQKGEEKIMEKTKIEVESYKFQNGETIDEILSKQTSWATDEEFLDNMIDNSLREVADFADEKENELLKKISIAKNNPEVDLKLLAVQTDAAARYMAAKHYDDYFAEYAPKEDLLNVINFSNWTYFNSEKISTKVYDVEISASLYEQLLPSEYKERSIKEDEVVCIQYRKSVLSEEQDQFLIEKFDKNNFMLLQQKEIQIDVELKNKIKSICNSYIEPQNNNSYTDEILDKIRAAGIEVVTDKDEFDRILTEKTNGRPDIALNQLYHDKFDEYKTKREELAKINDEDIVMQHKNLLNDANSFTKEATDTIQTVIAQNSYALEHSSIREQVGAVIDSIPLANEKSTIINNNEKSQKSHSNAKEYMIQTTRLFLSKLKEKSLPFLQGKEQGSKIIIKPQAVREALTGKAFTGYTQLMAQALIQAVYEQKKIPELEYELITYDQAKNCGTFIKKGSPHITLTNYNTRTNTASKQMYYFKSGCKSPEIIDLTRDSITRNRIIKKIRLSLSDKELTSEQQAEEKNKITLLHYKELTYLKTLKKDAEQYINSLPAEEKNMLTELCTKKPLEQKTVQELAQTLRKNKLLSTQLSSQKNSERSFDATECIVPEDFIAKAMAAASLGCSLETTEKTIEIITRNLHQTLSNNIEHYDYGKAFDVGEVINEKCIKNCKEMKNQEYEAAELVKKLEQKQQELKKNPIGILTELLNKTELSNRTIGGYER